MARRRIEIAPAVEEQIRALMQRGGTAETISAALRASGVKASRTTIGRRMAELKGKAPSKTSAAAPPAPETAAPPTSDEILGADPADLPALLERTRAAGREATRAGNLAAVGAMGRLELQIHSEMRKAAPTPIQNPNDDVDMQALGAEVAERFHKLIDLVVKP